MKPIEIQIKTAVTGQQDVEALARDLEGLADTLEGDLKTQALASAKALRELGAKQGAIENFVNLKTQAGEAAQKLGEAQVAAQKLGKELGASAAPTRTQSVQLEKLRDAVRGAKTELQEKTRALDNSRAVLRTYGVASDSVASSERATRQAIAQAREEVTKLAPVYAAAGNAAAASGLKQTQSTQAVKASLSGIGDTLRKVQTIALTAVGGTFLTGVARDVSEVADGYKNLRARIALVTGEGAPLEAAFDGVKSVALETNSELDGTASLFTKILASGKELGVSQEQALSLTKTINQTIQLSGGSADSAKAAIVQLVQGLQSGVLRGDEFNSVMEQSPRLAKALADGLGVTIGQLRTMAKEGKLTSETVITALQGQTDAVATEFAKLPPTVGRAIQNLSTNWTLYVGEVDKATGASAAAANAINAVAENLDEIAGMASRAGAVVAAAMAIQAAGALRTYIAEVGAAKAATSLLSLEMSKIPKTLQIAVAFAGFEAGFQIGTLLRENSELARKLGVGFVEFVEKQLNSLQFLAEAGKAVFTDDTIGAAMDRYNKRADEQRVIIAQMYEDAVKAPGQIEAAVNKAAVATSFLGESARKAQKAMQEASTEQVKAIDALRISRSADAQVALSSLETQRELSLQSEEMAHILGDEKAARLAKIETVKLEIQIVEAKAAVARIEAEGSIAVAEAKLAEMKVSNEVNAVKEAELQSSIKLARAKIAEADATGKSADLLRKQLELFQKAGTAASGLGSNLDGLSKAQSRFAGATNQANEALERQQALANAKYSSPLGDTKYSRPAGGSVTGNTREERLAGQSASDESLRFELLSKLQGGGLTSADLGGLKAAVEAIKTNQAIFDSLSPGLVSLEGLADDRKWANARTGFEQAIARFEGQAGTPSNGAASVGKTISIDLRVNGDHYGEVPTTEAGANIMSQWAEAMKRAKRSAQ